MNRASQVSAQQSTNANHALTVLARGGKPPVQAENRLARLQASYGNQGMLRLISGGVLQRKLTINQPGDVYEQEAERVSDAVMRMPESQTAEGAAVTGSASRTRIQRACRECEEELSSRPAVIQRMCASCKEELTSQPTLQGKGIPGGAREVTPEIASRVQSLQGGGQALPASVRDFFEPRFGRDFSHVQVHTDPESTRSLEARAYTVGRSIVFGAGQYAPETSEGKKLLAHELTHVVQQGGAAPQPLQRRGSQPPRTFSGTKERAGVQVSNVIQRAGDPKAIPKDLPCPTDLTPGRPAGTDLLFPSEGSTITPAHTALLTTFRAAWLAAGGTDDILVHGYASTDGPQDLNWRLSCDRAQHTKAELKRLGIPDVRIDIVAHGESTDFGPGAAPNRHAVVTSSASILPLPLVTGVLTARDNFASRSTTRFGVGEIIDLNFFSFPPRPAADFGGLEWHLVSGGGTLTGVTAAGTATYTAPATASAVQLELRVASGATAGRVVSAHAITIVIPSAVRMTAVPGTAPTFGGVIAPGTWGAGFRANVFVDPRDVSFQGVVFGEGTVAAVVTPAGSFLAARAGLVHPVNTFGAAHGGNATTGTPVSPPVDNIATAGGVTPTTVLGINFCGASDFLWAIPWEFSVGGGPRTPFAGGFTANHHVTSTLFCNATIEKGGAGPFCRRLNGTTC